MQSKLLFSNNSLSYYYINVIKGYYYYLQEVVARFRSQGETQKHLENLKKDNVAQIHKIQEEKFKLQQQFEEMKYSGEAKLSRYILYNDDFFSFT